MFTKKQIRHLIQLKQKKYRRERKEFLVEGIRLCEELFRSCLTVNSLFVTKNFGEKERELALLEQSRDRNIEIKTLDDFVLHRFCATTTPQPIVAWVKMRDSNSKESLKKHFSLGRRFLVLDGVSEPGNVGTLLRTAEAFGWDSITFLGDCPELHNPKVLRASMGAAFRIPTFYSNYEEVLSIFEDTGVSYLLSLADEGAQFPLKETPPKLALFLGSEAHGVGRELRKNAYNAVNLKMCGGVESINVASAGAIFLYLLK